MSGMAESQLELEHKLLEVLTPEYLESLIKFLKIIRRIDELGILDSLNDLLSEEVISDLARNLLMTSIIKVLNDYEKVLSIIAKLSEPGIRDGIEKVLDLVNAVNNTGLLDALRNMLGDPEVMSELAHSLINENSVYLINNLDTVFKLTSSIVMASQDAIRRVTADGGSVIETISELLRDGDARRGLRFLLLMAKGLGRQLAEARLSETT